MSKIGITIFALLLYTDAIYNLMFLQQWILLFSITLKDFTECCASWLGFSVSGLFFYEYFLVLFVVLLF